MLDALELGRVSLWGHSDGAVIAFKIALTAPDRVDRIVTEAAHYFPIFDKKRVFAVHMGVSYVNNEKGDRVPFYAMPYIGGSDTVRASVAAGSLPWYGARPVSKK